MDENKSIPNTIHESHENAELNDLNIRGEASSLQAKPEKNDFFDVNEDNEFEKSISKNSRLTKAQIKLVKEVFKDDLSLAIVSVKQEVQNDSRELKKDFLTIFGLFASFMTFLTIEIQVFKTAKDILEIAGMSILTLSFIILFALILNSLNKGDETSIETRIVNEHYGITIIFFVTGICMIFVSASHGENDHKHLQKRVKEDSIKFLKIEQKMDSLEKELYKTNVRIDK